MTANLIFLICSVATKQWSKTDKLEILFLLILTTVSALKTALPCSFRISWLLVTCRLFSQWHSVFLSSLCPLSPHCTPGFSLVAAAKETPADIQLVQQHCVSAQHFHSQDLGGLEKESRG